MKILIVDDHEEILIGIESRVNKVFPDSESYSATTISDALFLIRKHQIGLLLCDLQFQNTSEKNGWELLRKVLVISPNTKSIAYTGHGSYNVMKESIDSGFHSFLEKGCSFQTFEQTLIAVMSQGFYESESILKLKQKRHSIVQYKFQGSIDLLSQLSQRELEVSILISETLNTTLIADSLSDEKSRVKPSSVETYIKRIMLKLSIDSRRDLALFCSEFLNQLETLKKK